MSISCSTNSTVVSVPSTARMITSISGNFSSAATPLVGSSSNRSLGLHVTDMATSTSLRTPPGNTAIVCSRYSRKRKRPRRSSSSAMPRSERAGCHDDIPWSRKIASAKSKFWSNVRLVKSCGIWNERLTPSRRTCRGARPVMSLPSSMTWPASGFKPDAGHVMLDGKDITGRAPRQVRRDGVSRSFQIPQLFTSLTLDQNLLLALAILRDQGMSSWQPARSDLGIAELDDLLGRFRLREYREQTIAVLPGGVRKLVDVAMAVTCRPKLLLLDEPTSGVAAEEKFPLMDVIMRAVEGTDTTVLFVEHDMDIVGRYADRVLAFYAGRIIADGAPGAVLSNEEVQRYVPGGAACALCKSKGD